MYCIFHITVPQQLHYSIPNMFPFIWLFAMFGIYLFWHFYWKRRHLPPGPVPVPLLGNTLTLAKYAPGYGAYRLWAEQYGGVYTFWLGEDPVVVVSDWDTIRDTFIRQGEAFAGRHLMTALNEVLTETKGNYGVIRTEGEQWRTMRRFALHSLRDLGMGRNQLEQKFLDDLNTLVLWPLATELSNGCVLHRLDPLVDRLAGSTINQLLFGHGFTEENLDEFFQLKNILEEQRRTIVTLRGRLLMGMPFLRHFPLFSSTFAKFDSQVSATYKFFERPIRERMEQRKCVRGCSGSRKSEEALKRTRNGTGLERNGTDSEHPTAGGKRRDMLDCFLDQMEAAAAAANGANGDKGGQNGPMKHFDLKNLRSLCYDLFLAGQETICITLNFLILYMLLDQRAQAKMQRELDQFLKRTNRAESDNSNKATLIRLEDRSQLPYVNAVINETQRVCNLLPLNLTHRTTCDVRVGKFRLPKGTSIVPQISSVLYDDTIFRNPQKFEPERFVDAEGRLKNVEQFVPFGVGKRRCLGEQLARMELFLFTANFFANFSVHPEDPLNPPSAAKQLGFGVFPHPFSCRVERRRQCQFGQS